MILSDLYSNFNDFMQVLSINVFLVDWLDDCFVNLDILSVASKISNPSFSGSVLLNCQPISCYMSSCLFIFII